MDVPVIGYIILGVAVSFALVKLACWWVDQDLERNNTDEGFGP